MSAILPSTADRSMVAMDPSARQPAAAASDPGKRPSISSLYFSPVVRLDPETEIAVWQFRDPTTGKVVEQYPAERTIAAYRAQLHDKAPAAGGAPVSGGTRTVSEIAHTIDTLSPARRIGSAGSAAAAETPREGKAGQSSSATESGSRLRPSGYSQTRSI
jgi:hypothetical protein